MSLSDKDNFCYDNLSRRELRSLIFHLIYSIDSFDYNVSMECIVDNLSRGWDVNIPMDSEVVNIAKEVVKDRVKLDRAITPLLDNWRLERVGICTKLILRLSIWELLNTETASNIIINEAIELAKCFSEKDAYRFVNGILDEICKQRKDCEA